MLFLYVFGSAVEDQLGKLAYLFFYLAGGVLAGLAHIKLGVMPGPVLGASGAVAGVTGAYLALFPLSNVTIAYWLVVFIGSFVVSSMVLIVFRIVMDVLFQFGNIGNTAYIAHLAGYVYGFAIGMFLLVMRLVPRERYDMLSLIEHQRRRRRSRALAGQPYDPWNPATLPTPTGSSQSSAPAPGRESGSASKALRSPGKEYEPGSGDPVNADTAGDGRAATGPSTDDQALMDRRQAIAAAVSRHDVGRAAELYHQLLRDRPDQVMGLQVQLDLATQLAAEERHAAAARAYELFSPALPTLRRRGPGAPDPGADLPQLPRPPRPRGGAVAGRSAAPGHRGTGHGGPCDRLRQAVDSRP